MNSLAHTSWECKYHIVFAPKYRRQVIYGKMKAEIGKILRELCERKGIEIIAAECCPDHIHMLIRIPVSYTHLDVYKRQGRRPAYIQSGNGQLSGAGSSEFLRKYSSGVFGYL